MSENSPWEAAQAISETSDAPAKTEFVGSRGRLFWMSLKLGFLTVITLGIYRFWMKTRLRRWYWSAIRPQGHPLEYVGDPWEKLLGFLFAVVILAFYIGVVNLLLMFASFSLFNGNVVAYVVSLVGVIPLWFFARYRARRYALARTRWRGVRFGLAPGAWGYAGRALLHWFLTLITFGFLWPRKAFYLEKYVSDRTYFGDKNLEQGGNWYALLGPYLGVWLPFVLGGLIPAAALMIGSEAAPTLASISFLALVLWVPIGLVRYNVSALRYLTSEKTIAGASLQLEPRNTRVFAIYFWGYGLVGTVAVLLIVPFVLLSVAMFSDLIEQSGLELQSLSSLPSWVLPATGIATYFILFLMWATLVHVFVRMPLFRHLAESFTILNAAAFDAVAQRPRDEFGEAEGFAEALDVGSAI